MAQPENVRNPYGNEKVSVDAFAAGVKAEYPEYKDVDNNELVAAMIEKYPQYADQVEYYPSKKKDSTESPSTMAGEPTDLASQPQMGSEVTLGQRASSEADKLESEESEPVSFLTSISNSGKNIGKQLSLLDDKLNVATDALFTSVLGKETADSWYEWSSNNLWGENVNESAAKSLREIERVESTMGETRGIIESAKKGDVVGIAAGTVDAVSSLAVSMIEGSILWGAPLAIDVVGGSIASYNNEKAKTLGKDSVELWESDEAEILMPTITGSISYALEKFGQGKLAKDLGRHLLGKEVAQETAKQFGKFGASRFGKAFLSNPNKEGMTEFMQGMIEQYSLSDARGESFDAIDYITSEEAWEQYVMGAVGAKVLEVGGKRIGVGTTAMAAQKQAKKEEILEIEEAIQDPATPAEEKRELRKEQEILAEEIQEIQEEEKTVLETYSKEDVDAIADIDSELRKKQGVLKRSKNPKTKERLEKSIEALVLKKKTIEEKYGEVEQTTEQESFVETGEVSDEAINSIATKVKDGEELTQEEQAIYQEKSQEVESKLQEFAKQETPVEETAVEEATAEETPVKKTKQTKQEEVTVGKSVYVIAEDGTITNKKSGKVISEKSVTARSVQKARTAKVETTEVETPKAKAPKTVKKEPKKTTKKTTKKPVETKVEQPTKKAVERKKKADKKEIEAKKKVLEIAPRKKYDGIKAPLMAGRRGWITVVEKKDKRSGKVTKFEAEVFVNTVTGKVSHVITEYRDGKKVKSTPLKDAKSFRDAVNKRLKSGAVVAETFQREYDSKVEGAKESKEAESARIIQPKKEKSDKYTQERQTISYEDSKGNAVTINVLKNRGNRPAGDDYAILTYSDGRRQTFSSEQQLNDRLATIARRKNVKQGEITTTTKNRKANTQTTSGVAQGIIMPEVGKKFKRRIPKKRRKLPSNTKPFKPMRVKQASDFEASVFKVFTPDGDSLFFQKQADGEYYQVDLIPNSRGDYSVLAGAKGYETLPKAVKEFKEEYIESKKDTDPEPPTTPKKKSKEGSKKQPKKTKAEKTLEDSKKLYDKLPEDYVTLAKDAIAYGRKPEVLEASRKETFDRSKRESALLAAHSKKHIKLRKLAEKLGVDPLNGISLVSQFFDANPVEKKQLRPRLAIRLKSRDSKAQNSSGVLFSVIDSTIQKANQLLSVFAPDVTIITHTNSREYANAMKENARSEAESNESARFIYNVNTGAREIHINTDLATKTTAVHEVFHAFFNTSYNSDPQLANGLAKSLYKALKNGSKQDQIIADRLMRLIERYEGAGAGISGEVRGEEFMAELAGIMSQTDGVLETSTLKKVVNAIKEFLLSAADRLGIDNAVIGLLRADVASDKNEASAVEFIKGFVNATKESSLAPEQNRIKGLNPVERKQLTQEEQEALSSLSDVKSEERQKIQSVKDVFSLVKGFFSNVKEKAKESGTIYTDTQKKINSFLESMNSQLSRTAFRVRIQGRMLRKLANTPEKLALVEEYLVAAPEAKAQLREKIEKLDKGDKILAVADGMRAFIDGLSQKFLESPYFDSLPEIGFQKVESYVSKKKNGKTMYRIINTRTGEVMEAELTKTVAYQRVKEKGLRDIIRENLGTYLHTSYRFFKDKKFEITDASKRKATQGAYETLKAQRLEDLIKEGKTQKEALDILRSKEEISSLMAEAKKGIDDYVSKIEAQRDDSQFKFSGLSTTGMKIPKPAFQRKKGLPDYIETLLGKEKDPVNRFTDSAVVMMQTFYKAQLVSKISDALGTDYIKEDSQLTEEEKASGNWKKMDDPYSPVNGKYVQAEVFEMLQSQALLSSDNAIINGYFKGLKLMRKSKVVWNIPTWRKNWTGGWFFMATNGIINKNMAKDTLNRAERLFKGMSNPEIEALLDEMAENGLIGADVSAGLIDLNDAALGMMFTEEPIGKYEAKFKKFHKKLKNADSRLAEKYAAVDDYTKLVIYRVEKESFAKKLYGKNYSELTESQQSEVREQAAEFVKQNTPTFSRLPKWYTKGRLGGKNISFAQVPFGDFLGFKLESVRSMYSNIKNAKEDLEKSKDKSLSDVQRAEYRKAGTRRMAGSLSVLSMRMAIPAVAAAIALDDEDEEIAEDVTKLRPSWMEGHTLLVKSISDDGIAKVYDYSMEDPYAELTSFNMSFFEDFTSPNMLLKLAVHLSEGKDAYGRDLYEKADPAILKMAKALKYTTKQMVIPPSAVALAKYKDPSQMVIRDYEINVGQQFYFQAKEYISKEKYTDLTGRARKNRLSALDDVKEMYDAVLRIAFSKGNMKLATDANKVINGFGSVEKAYIMSGVVVEE